MTDTTSKADLKAMVIEELLNIAPEVSPDEIDPDEDVREGLDIDSMDALNYISALHKRLGVDIPEADYPEMMTVNKAVAYLAAKEAG